MLPDRVSNPGPLTYESGALPIALRGPASGNSDIFVQPLIITLIILSFIVFLILGNADKS